MSSSPFGPGLPVNAGAWTIDMPTGSMPAGSPFKIGE